MLLHSYIAAKTDRYSHTLKSFGNKCAMQVGFADLIPLLFVGIHLLQSPRFQRWGAYLFWRGSFFISKEKYPSTTEISRCRLKGYDPTTLCPRNLYSNFEIKCQTKVWSAGDCEKNMKCISFLASLAQNRCCSYHYTQFTFEKGKHEI